MGGGFIADCARRFMAHPQVKGRRVLDRLGSTLRRMRGGLPLTPGVAAADVNRSP